MDEKFLPLMKFTNASVVWVRCCDGCPFGTIVNMDGKFEVKKTPQEMGEAELPATDNTTKDKIKPCTNEGCPSYLLSYQDGSHCVKYKPINMPKWCRNYRA